jgi:hypothetical protein
MASLINTVPSASGGISKLRERVQKRGGNSGFVPMPADVAAMPNLSLVDEPFWNELPDILQAQILVAINHGRPKKGQPLQAAEKLLWAGSPYLRTSKIISLFFVWCGHTDAPT